MPDPHLPSEPADAAPSASRAASSGTPRGWALCVASSVAIPPAAAIVGLPVGLGWGLATALALVVIGDRLRRLVRGRKREIDALLTTELERTRAGLTLEAMADLTHGKLDLAITVLTDAIADASPEQRPGLTGALDDLKALEAELRGAAPSMGVRRRPGRAFAVGGLVADRTSYDDADARRYAHPSRVPTWIRHSGARMTLTRVGDVLDDVRRLHSAEIEGVVLLLTLWARLLIVGAAPWLGALSIGALPLSGSPTAADLPWAAALAISLATALAAPRIATEVMRRDDHGRRVRRALLTVEIPIAVAALLCTPCWPVLVFAAGWTNWWQRPAFSYIRLGWWVLLLLGLAAAGGALGALSVAEIATEVAIGMLVIALIGDSYGALLPVSAGLTTRVIIGGLLAPRQARSQADDGIAEAIQLLTGAADALDRDQADGSAAPVEATELRAAADQLAARADREARLSWRAPLGLVALVEDALLYAAPLAESAPAHALAERARRAGRAAPLTIVPDIDWPVGAQRWRYASRRSAACVRALIIEIVDEATRYGTGPLATFVLLDGDELVLRFVNRVASGVPQGRTTGEARVQRLAAEAGGRLTERQRVTGPALGVRPGAQRFVVEVRLPAPHH